MSLDSLNLLIDAGLLTSSYKPINIRKLPKKEILTRLEQYVQNRVSFLESEISSINNNSELCAQFSLQSTRTEIGDILVYSLLYEHILLDDPILTDNSYIDIETLEKGLEYFSKLSSLIKNNLVSIFPISFYTRHSSSFVPIFSSQDAFRSAIPENIHDFIHERADLRANAYDTEKGISYVLVEKAHVRRKSAITVLFEGDSNLKRAVNLFRFETQELIKSEDGSEKIIQTWNPEMTLSQSKFEKWAYQVVNQAIMVRLRDISNEIRLADKIGHTYITESDFEAQLLSLTSAENVSKHHKSIKFLKANEESLSISSADDLCRVRSKYEIAFKKFHSSLLDLAQELEQTKPEEFEHKAKRLYKKEIVPQIEEINKAIHSISKGTIIGGVGSATSISMGLVSSSNMLPLSTMLLLTTGQSLIGAYNGISDYQRYKKKPQFIWHKLTKN